MNNDKRSLITNATKWSAITSIMRKLVTPITSMVLARLLTPSVFGIIASLNIVISFAQIFSDAGFQKYLVQHEFKSPDELKEASDVAFTTNLIFSLLLWLVIFLFRDPLSDYVGSSGYGVQMCVAALVIPITSFSSIQQSLFKRDFDFKALFVPQLVNSLIPLIITVPLAILLRNTWSLIIGTIAANISDAIFYTVKCKWKPRIYLKNEVFKRMFGFSAWTMLETVSIWLTVNVDIFILGKSLDSTYLGMYKTGITTVNQITAVVTTTILPVLFSSLSRCQDDRQQFEKTLFAFQKYAAIILFPLSIGMLIYSDLVTKILLGKQWMDISTFIGLLGLTQAGSVIFSNYASEVYRSYGEPKISLFAQILYILFTIPPILWGVKQDFSVLCNVRVGLMVVFMVLHLVILKVRYKFSILKMFHSLLQPLIAAIIMGIIAYFLHDLIKSLVGQVISVIVCMIAYFSSLFIFPQTREIAIRYISIIKSRVRREKE